MRNEAIKETPGIPLPACVASVWGGFLVEGLFSVGATADRQAAVLQSWGRGCIELVIASSLFLPIVWRQICAQWEKSDADMPGVFEYEVVSPLGHYLGDYLLANGGALPAPEVVKAETERLIARFFASEAAPELASAVAGTCG